MKLIIALILRPPFYLFLFILLYANSYTDDTIILLNFIFTCLHDYQITLGLTLFDMGFFWTVS